MTLDLMYNTDDHNVINKNPTVLESYEYVVGNGSSVIDPIFILHDDIDVTESNYCYVPAWGRYYYINDMITNANGLWELHCHVDVLMSFASGILDNDALIARQENDYNLYLPDGRLKTVDIPLIQTLLFPDGFGNNRTNILILSGPKQ